MAGISRDSAEREVYGTDLDAAAKAQIATVAADVQSLSSAMPQPASAAPPAVQIDSAKGSAPRFALEDHTHESRLQGRRIQVTPDAQGQYVYVFPKPYAPGVVPIVNVTAETAAGASSRNDASIVQGSTTNLQTTILITKLNATIVATVLGGVITMLSPQTGAVWVNIMSRAPS